MTEFEILSEIKDIETIATGRAVYIRRYLETRLWQSAVGGRGKVELL